MARPKTKVDLKTRSLVDLGLTENEAVLYALMLEREPTTVQELGIQSPLPRTLLYHVLNQLARRGLVATKKDGWRTVYVALDPENLYDLLAEKEKELQRQGEVIRGVIPQFKQSYLLAGNRPTVRTFEGVDGLEKALESTLISGTKEIFAFENLTERKSGFETHATYERRRAQRKVQKNVVFFENSQALKALIGKGYNDYTQYRGVQGGAVKPFTADVMLFSGKVLYMTSYGEHEPIVILIEDQALYEMQKNLFDTLWSTGTDRTLYYAEKQ